jgi:hypothetical protein
MSTGKFAAMTANLLARKGDAQPSTMPEHPPASRGFNWTGLVTPPVHRHFERVDSVFKVPPPDGRAAEGGAFVRSGEDQLSSRDLRYDTAAPDPRVEPVGEAAAEAPAEARPSIKAREPAVIEKPRRLFVNLTPEDYERLGIVAVKRDSTRHQLLRDALDAFIEKSSIEIDCACVATGGCKNNCE